MSARPTTCLVSGSRDTPICDASFCPMIGKDIRSAKITWCRSSITTFGCRSRTSTRTVVPTSLAHQRGRRDRDTRDEGIFCQCVHGDLDGAGRDAPDVLAPVYSVRHIAVSRREVGAAAWGTCSALQQYR